VTGIQLMIIKRKISQREVAKKLNVTPSAVNKWVTGVALPRPDKLRKLAQILGVTVDQLLNEKEES